MADRLTLKQRAADLRRGQTSAERLLWSRLRMRQVGATRFLRQYVIGNFIVDFYVPAIRLAVELDGGQHYDTRAVRYDGQRTEWLEVHGVTVLRYTNLDVTQRLDDVLRDINRMVSQLQTHLPAAAQGPASFRSG